MIIATAGHIDHGKTSLIRALTGLDTDRLPEERVRGISIDLGFAHAELAGGSRISFVDVPGHERFVRNMLAGVCGIDGALLVLAADDGVMPQTLEHLAILDLLDVRHGCVVVTKIDRVDAARVDEVCAQAQAMLARTSLQDAPIFAVSTSRGLGIQQVADWLDRLAEQSDARPLQRGYHFRMAVDRSFSLVGSGTIITGTVRAGTVRAGTVATRDQLVISPSGTEVRVRRVHAQGEVVDRAVAGQRCALNVTGVAANEVGRGDWVVHAASHAPTQRIDVRLKVLSSEADALRHWTTVHLHLGTATVPARVSVAAEGQVPAGDSTFVQLLTDRPIVASHGDRFVVRDQGARRTIGGGVVLDPHPPKRRRGARLRDAELMLYERATPGRILEGLVDLREAGVDLNHFARSMNLDADGLTAAQEAANVQVLGRQPAVGVPRAAADALTVKILAALRQYHRDHPQAAGIELAQLHRLVAPRLPDAAFQACARELANRQLVGLSNDLLRLKSHDATANETDEQLWLQVHAALERHGVHVPLIDALAKALSMKEQPLRDFLHRKSRTGEIWRLAPERFALRATLAQVAGVVAEIASGTADGFLEARDLRDAIGTGRGLAIHYLELFDKLGITQRFGDRRRAGRDATSVLGTVTRP